jgi:hypothetical protein
MHISTYDKYVYKYIKKDSSGRMISATISHVHIIDIDIIDIGISIYKCIHINISISAY